MRLFRLALLLLAVCATSADARFPRGSGSATVAFTHVPIGGAGAVMGVSSVPSANLLLARTDQFNCYISINNSQWSPLLKTNNTPIPGPAVSSIGTPTGIGCGDVVAAKSAPTNIWVENSGQVWLSTDSGANFGSTCYPPQADGGPIQNQRSKAMSHVIGIDPVNPSVVYMGTDSNGLYATYNKGVNCWLITAVGTASNVSGSNNAVTGAPAGGNHLIAFDTLGGTLTNATTPACPHSATLCTKNIYASTYGTGVYQSTDGGATWTLKNSSGMPTNFVNIEADPFGNLFVLDDSNTNTLGVLRKFNGTAWSTPASGTTNGIGIAIDPNACSSSAICHIAIVRGGGQGSSGSSFSTDGGVNWYNTSTVTTVSTDVPWLAGFVNNGFGQYPAGAAFDNLGNVYTGGEGVFNFTPPTSGGVTYTSKTVGIEESLSSNVATSTYTTGKIAMGTWDVNCFVQLAQPYTSLPTTPNRGCYATNTPELQHTFAIDWASATTSFFVALTDNQQYGAGYNSYSGKSTDGGASWTALSVPPSVTASGYGMSGGCLAAASTTNYMLVSTDGNAGTFTPQYTTNGGTSWNRISLSNLTGNVTASATAAAGTRILTFASVPAWVAPGMGVLDDTTPGATRGAPTIIAVNATTVTLNKDLTGQVTSGDSMYISTGGWITQNYVDGKMCAADRDSSTNPNTFYLYNWNDGAGDAFIKCTSGGASCAIQSTPSIGANSPYSGVLKTVPGKAGHFFFSYRGNDPPNPLTGSFRYYTDGGVTPNTVPLMTMVFSYGFGAAAPGHTYPAIVVNGAYNGVYGIWQSVDWDGAKTWQQIGTFPMNLAVQIKDIDGDKVIPNVFYYTTNSGLFCSAPSTTYCNGGT